MSERKCGYCRDEGHIKRNCSMLHEQRRTLFTHVVANRKRIYKELIESGYGVGALVEAKSYNGSFKGIITTFANSIPLYESYNTKRIKYSKQVRINYVHPRKDEYHYVGFQIAVLGGGVHTVSIPYCSLYWSTEGEFEKRTYGARILSPSYDLDETVGDEVFEKDIFIHERLTLAVDKVGLGMYEDAKLHKKNIIW